MSDTYDTIIIGAGHNGLVAAAYLAKARQKSSGPRTPRHRRRFGRDRIVWRWLQCRFRVDRRNSAPGHYQRFETRASELTAETVQAIYFPPTRWQPPTLDPDPLKAAESIKRFSEKDAARWGEFVRFMDKAANILDIAYATIMPRLPKNFSLSEGYGLLELGLELRLDGPQGHAQLHPCPADDRAGTCSMNILNLSR